jgi:Tol biopolymer transport system component/DNA-binding winged helix-turn-helix (wHTH) protein
MSQAAAQSSNSPRFYDFGPFRVDAVNRLLLRERESVPLTSKVFDILLVFVSNSGRMLDKDYLMKEVWPESFVEEGNLTRNVSTLRKALGERPQERQYIVTVPGRGYRFVASVVQVQDDGVDVLIEEVTQTHITVEETEHQDTVPAFVKDAEEVPVVGPVTRSFSKLAVYAACAFVLTSLVLLVAYSSISRKSARDTPLASLKISRLSNLGNCHDATVSPDGKFLAFVLFDGGRQSLWLRQLATATDRQLLAPSEVRYFGVTFAPDGNHIYYVASHSKADKHEPRTAALYKLALLGGPATKINENLDSAISFSPDGSRYTFTREYTDAGESALMIASLEGSEETRLATRRMPEYFDFPVWSPDGKLIASVAASFRGPHQIAFYSPDGNSDVKQLNFSKPWGPIMKLLWTKGGSSLFVDAKDPLAGGSLQIWRLAYPSGEVLRITNDTNNYVRLSATADSGTLVGVESRMTYSMWIGRKSKSDLATEVVPTLDGFSGMSWMPDGRVIYAASSGANTELWVMNADGNDQKQLTAGEYPNQNPAVAPDGRYIYFTVYRPDSQDIWRMESEGLNRTPVTSGKRVFSIAFTPEGKSIVFTSRGSNRWSTLWKIPVEGGDALELSANLVRSPVVSPDGKLIACFYVDQQENSQTEQPSIALIPADGGEPLKIFKTSTTVNFLAGLQWAANGTAITYVDNRNGFSNIWGLQIDGSAPRQLTDFKGGQIFAFAWSHDGDRLAFLRGIEKTYAVVLTNLN